MAKVTKDTMIGELLQIDEGDGKGRVGYHRQSGG